MGHEGEPPVWDAPDGPTTTSSEIESWLIYRRLAQYDLGWETRTGLQLAFYRTFAIPRIAGLLQQTGEIRSDPLKRSLDTGLFMYELIDCGVDSDRGREVIRSLNRMHRRWPVEEEDYRYVLTTFTVVPARWTAKYGRRALTEAEGEAVARFYREVGRRMGVRDLPADYAESADLLDAYEEEHLGWSAAGAALMASADRALSILLPRPLRRSSRFVTSLMLDDRMCRALGVRRPPRLARAAFAQAMTVRRSFLRYRPPAGRPIFDREVAGAAVYPDGYEIADLGVRTGEDNDG